MGRRKPSFCSHATLSLAVRKLPHPSSYLRASPGLSQAGHWGEQLASQRTRDPCCFPFPPPPDVGWAESGSGHCEGTCYRLASYHHAKWAWASPGTVSGHLLPRRYNRGNISAAHRVAVKIQQDSAVGSLAQHLRTPRAQPVPIVLVIRDLDV